MKWSVLVSRRLWLAAVMGFAGGLPLLLTLTVLQAWMTEEEVSLTAIGVFSSAIGLPYSIKFLWAPMLDRFELLAIGRRRGWLLIAQFGLIGSIALLGIQDPGENLWAVALAAFIVTFFSATQDIVIDAYRRESLADAEQGLGASFYTYGYRLGMLVASGGGLILSDVIGYGNVYFLMAGIMACAVLVSLSAPEPGSSLSRPSSFAESIVGPFREFLTRHGAIANAMLVLAFIVLYKLGDNLASHMSIPFYLNIGFTNTEVGAIVKVFGTGALLAGVFIGGAMVLRVGLFRSMIVIGVLQSLSTACFALLAQVGDDSRWLAGVIAFENLSGGMGTAALLAFMALLTNRAFTATQFALLSTLATLPRAVLAAPSGWFAELLGWTEYFVACALIAIPGMLLLLWLRPWFGEGAAPVQSGSEEGVPTPGAGGHGLSRQSSPAVRS